MDGTSFVDELAKYHDVTKRKLTCERPKDRQRVRDAGRGVGGISQNGRDWVRDRCFELVLEASQQGSVIANAIIFDLANIADHDERYS